MNRTLPPFNPPARPRIEKPNFKDYWKTQEKWLDDYQKYMFEYVAQLVSVVNTGSQGFALGNVASATTLHIGAFTTIITGTTAIQTIQTDPNFSGSIILVSRDGYSTVTGGNISAAVTVAAGQAGIFTFDPVTNLWYPSIGFTSVPSSLVTQFRYDFLFMGG